MFRVCVKAACLQIVRRSKEVINKKPFCKDPAFFCNVSYVKLLSLLGNTSSTYSNTAFKISLDTLLLRGQLIGSKKTWKFNKADSELCGMVRW